MPWPKARCAAGSRATSKRSASRELALVAVRRAESSSTVLALAGSSRRGASTSRVARARQRLRGDVVAQHLLDRARDARRIAPRAASRWSRMAASSTAPLAIRFVVVSLPATISTKQKPSSSRRAERSPSISASSSALIRSSRRSRLRAPSSSSRELVRRCAAAGSRSRSAGARCRPATATSASVQSRKVSRSLARHAEQLADHAARERAARSRASRSPLAASAKRVEQLARDARACAAPLGHAPRREGLRHQRRSASCRGGSSAWIIGRSPWLMSVPSDEKVGRVGRPPRARPRSGESAQKPALGVVVERVLVAQRPVDLVRPLLEVRTRRVVDEGRGHRRSVSRRAGPGTASCRSSRATRRSGRRAARKAPITGSSTHLPRIRKRSVRSVRTTPSGVSARWCTIQSTSRRHAEKALDHAADRRRALHGLDRHVVIDGVLAEERHDALEVVRVERADERPHRSLRSDSRSHLRLRRPRSRVHRRAWQGGSSRPRESPVVARRC